MTEKRFEINNLVVKKGSMSFWDNENKSILNASHTLDLLNNLSEENEQLKEDYDYLEKRFKEEEWHYEHIDEDRDAWHYKCTQLEKENEQLKKFKNKTFDLLDKEIAENEEAIEWGEKRGVGVGAIGFHTNMLKILRKELKE